MAKKEPKPAEPEKITIENVWDNEQKFINVHGLPLAFGERRENVPMDQEVMNLLGVRPPYIRRV